MEPTVSFSKQGTKTMSLARGYWTEKFSQYFGHRPVLQEKPGIKDWCRAFPLGSVQPQVVMGDAAPQGEENLQAVRIGKDAFLKGKAAFVLDVVLNIAFGKV